MKIIAVRHGQTDGNISRLIQSRTDGKLTMLGIEQAKETALKLRDYEFSKIYCSTLGRCKETLSYITEFHKSTPIYYSEKLIELGKGDLEGMSWTELPSNFYSESHIEQRISGGESWVDLDERIREFLNDIFDTGVDSVLVVTHDGPLKVIHSILENIPLVKAIQVMYDNAGIYELEMKSKVAPERVK